MAPFELLHSASARHPLSPYIHALTFLRSRDLFVHRRLGTVCAHVLGPLGRRQAGRANRRLEPTPTAEVCMEQQNDETTHPIYKNGLVIEPPSSVEDEREHGPPLPFMPSPPAASCSGTGMELATLPGELPHRPSRHCPALRHATFIQVPYRLAAGFTADVDCASLVRPTAWHPSWDSSWRRRHPINGKAMVAA